VKRIRRYLPVLLLPLLAAGCSPPDVPRARDAEMPRPVQDPGTGTRIGGSDQRQEEPSAVETEAPLVVFLGNSLTAGYGLSMAESYPVHAGRLLAERGLPVRIVNAGVSGDTSAGGLERLGWLLGQRPDIVMIELGGNDGLRGQPLEAIEANLNAVVERAQAAGANVILAGMRIPPSYGPQYVAGFEAIYPRVAREHGVALVPFLLEGVAADPELNLPDGIHPNARGQQIIAVTVADALAPMIERLGREI
jgi:acyl-CoA thioesterase-1